MNELEKLIHENEGEYNENHYNIEIYIKEAN